MTTDNRQSHQAGDGGPQTATPTYRVRAVSQPVVIDADFDKPVWQQIEPLEIGCVQPTTGAHRPRTQVKLRYDERCVYVIFRVRDQYVRAVATDTHGPVWQDSCVEFFFTPHAQPSSAYFNLEVNCCGVLLAQCHTGPRQNSRFLDRADCQHIQIAASASGPIRREIVKPLAWTIEVAVPVDILTHYMPVEAPAPGVQWRANFYKCADGCSHPHWLSWSPIQTDRPDFHRPDGFGLLQFV